MTSQEKQTNQDRDELIKMLKRMKNRAIEQEDRWIIHEGFHELPEHLKPNAEAMDFLCDGYCWYSMSVDNWKVSLISDVMDGKIELYIERDDEMFLLARTHKDNIPEDDLLALYRNVQQIAVPDPNAIKYNFMSLYNFEGMTPEEAEAALEAWETMQQLEENDKGDIAF